jgi:very-short-patch-repair endonuclease
VTQKKPTAHSVDLVLPAFKSKLKLKKPESCQASRESKMELTGKLLSNLQNRLKVGNRRGVHLNAIPSNSRYKFDLNRLSYLGSSLPQDFINSLLSEQPLKFRISWKDNVPDLNSLFEDDQAQLVKITKSFENLINQTEAIESEKGINTFGFGFPLLARRDQADNKLTVAPILIWSLRIKRTKEFNTWIVQRSEDDPIYINEVLINHLQSDSKVTIDPISSEMLDDGLIDKEELLDICVDLIEAINSSTPGDIRDTFAKKLNNVKAIPDKKHFEKLPLTSNNSFVEFGGLFSIFEVQKQNIIDDYGDLLELENMTLDLEDLDDHTFQPLSSVETDPSQQSVLHSLESKRNILIQGPPGTGKSQSLTAVLINALENHKKTIVVCEKRTALEVLHNVLNEKGLGDHCILVKDIIKDRRTVVNSVRDRLDGSSYKRYRYVSSKETLDNLLSRSKSLIDSINRKHKKLGKKLLENNSWPNTVGMLLAELKSNKEDFELDFDKSLFRYESKELNELLQFVQKGQRLYDEYKPYQKLSFLNHAKLIGDNPYSLEQQIKEDFNIYLEKFRGQESTIHEIRQRNKDNPELFDLEKTGGLGYKLTALFSKRKKQTLTDQKQLFESCIDLAEQIENDNWNLSKINTESSRTIIGNIQSLLIAKQEFFKHENDLFSIEFKWFQFYNSLSETNRQLIDSLKTKHNWRKTLMLYYLNSLLILSASTDLPTNDNEHKELGDSLSKIGKEQLKYIVQYWYSLQIDFTRNFDVRNPSLSVENRYNKRSSHKHKRLSLRQIVKFDPDLFTTFFPIVLTTPDVSCNLFKGMNKYFDIALFDEASQLRLEDNLPALLKGKQIIIAGDEHQMPPSNYFSKIFDGTIDDEDEFDEENDKDENYLDRDDLLLSCESLLDFAGELSFEKRYLDFHYRSRHPYLIDFSNHAFYNKRLKPLPNDFDYTPIKYVQVGGTYSEHSNEREAEAVLSIIEHNIHRLPNGEYPSVGIATFNIAQRNLIKGKILDRQKFEHFSKFNQKIIELEEAGLFVKNLENIQGDERDVIILSTTYGTSKDGRFAERFGPINHKKGYKLLNVIVTRAKYKVYVCSSIPEQVFLNFKEHLITEGSNNRRAVFFAYLAYAKAVSAHDLELKQSVLNALTENSSASSKIDYLNEDLESPFEEEVYQALADNFDERKLTPQLQFAGFRIDIVYDPKIEGLPKIAIECDGAAYHSSKEAYLYDHHRQKILENHGFIFHRIWSTNWWRNPTREINRLVEFIKEIESKSPKQFDDKPNFGLAFSDDFKEIKIFNPTINSEPKQHVREVVQSLDHQVELQTQLFDKIIGLTSKVKVRYINNGKDLTVQLVATTPNKAQKSNGIQLINNRSPLAISIIGKSIGETVKLGDLDNYVEILEID